MHGAGATNDIGLGEKSGVQAVDVGWLNKATEPNPHLTAVEQTIYLHRDGTATHDGSSNTPGHTININSVVHSRRLNAQM